VGRERGPGGEGRLYAIIPSMSSPSLPSLPPGPSAWGFDRLVRVSIDRPRTMIAVFVALVALAAPGLFRLELRTDGHALVPADDPAVRFDAEVRRHFGLHDPIVVVLETGRRDGIFDPAVLRRLAGLTAALARVPGIAAGGVMSLATEKRDRVYPGTLDFRPFLDPIPDDPVFRRLFREDLDAVHLLRGTLVSLDRSALAVLVPAPDVAGERTAGDRLRLYRRIVAVAGRFAGGGARIDVVGAPVAEALLGTSILADLARLLPLSLALISVVLWLGCRRLWGVLSGLAEAAAGQIFTFGMMGWLGVPVHLTTAVLPVLLTALGIADEIHIFWRYQRLLGPAPTPEDAEHPAAVRRLMARLTRPLALTSITTILGFLSFLSSPLAPVRGFGLAAAGGLTFCLLWSLAVAPATLALLPPAALRRPAGRDPRRFGERLRRALAPLFAQPRRTLAAIAIVTLALGAGAFRLYVQDSWIDSFAPGSPFRTAVVRVDRLFRGTHLLLVAVDFTQTDITDPLLDPQALAALGRFEAFLATQKGVGGALGPASHLAEMRYFRHAREPEYFSPPRTADEAADLLGWFDRVRTPARRREVIDDAHSRGVITLFLRNANYRDVAALMTAARRYAAANLAPRGARIGFAGDVAVSQAMIPAIVTGQVRSLLLAPLGSLLLIVALCRSLSTGLAVALPALLAIVWIFGAMGWAGIPLGVASSMFCAITLGVGVDYGIHLYECFRLHRREGPPGEAALAALSAIAEAGPAIVADSTAISLGFCLLALSQVPPNARLGLLVAAALTVSCTLTLTGLGTLLSRAR